MNPTVLRAAGLCLLLAPSVALAAGGVRLLGIPLEFILFACTLIGIALCDHRMPAGASRGVDV